MAAPLNVLGRCSACCLRIRAAAFSSNLRRNASFWASADVGRRCGAYGNAIHGRRERRLSGWFSVGTVREEGEAGTCWRFQFGVSIVTKPKQLEAIYWNLISLPEGLDVKPPTPEPRTSRQSPRLGSAGDMCVCEGEGEEGWLGVVRPNRAAPRLAGRAETQQRAPTHSVARDPVINNAPADSQPPPTLRSNLKGAPY